MLSRLRVHLVILSVVSVLGAWAVWGPQRAAGAALWNPYDAVAEIKLPSSVQYPNLHAVEEYRGYVYVLDYSGVLFTYDTRDLPGRSEFKTYSAPIASLEASADHMLLRNGQWLYACGQDGLAVLDLSNPARPRLHVPGDGEDSYRNMFQSGDRLAVGGADTVAIYSLADPSRPVLLGGYSLTSGSVFAVAIHGDLMYWSQYTSGVSGGTLHALDISDPSHPSLVWSLMVPDLPYHMRILDGRLLCANNSSVALWSLANPRQPQVLDSQAASGRVCALDGGNIVTSGRVFRVNGDVLELVLRYATGGGQGDGIPHGSAVGSGYVFQAQTQRVLVLKGVAAPEAWPYQLRLPIVRNR